MTFDPDHLFSTAEPNLFAYEHPTARISNDTLNVFWTGVGATVNAIKSEALRDFARELKAEHAKDRLDPEDIRGVLWAARRAEQRAADPSGGDSER